MKNLPNLSTPAKRVKQFTAIGPEALPHKDFREMNSQAPGRVKQIDAESAADAVKAAGGVPNCGETFFTTWGKVAEPWGDFSSSFQNYGE